MTAPGGRPWGFRVLIPCGLIASLALGPEGARAAFELRDATPAALGAASADMEPEPMFESTGESRAGLLVSASHASLFQVEGLAADRAAATLQARSISLDLSYSQVGFAAARERRVRLSIQERGARPIAIALDVERLELALEGEPKAEGWAMGGQVRGFRALRSLDLEVAVGADRILRTEGARRLGIGGSLPFAIRVRTRGAALAWVDRWESDGRRSPRLILDFPLGEAARVRLGRGEAPGRIGAAFAVRLNRLEASVGRLDVSDGGVITGVGVALRAPRTRPTTEWGGVNGGGICYDAL